MKTTVDRHDFVRAFDQCSRNENFSLRGRFALFEYLEQLEEGTGEEMELDVIALCCDYGEYATALEAAKDMSSFEADPELDEDELEAAALEYLQDNTTVIEFEGGIIIQSF